MSVDADHIYQFLTPFQNSSDPYYDYSEDGVSHWRNAISARPQLVLPSEPARTNHDRSHRRLSSNMTQSTRLSRQTRSTMLSENAMASTVPSTRPSTHASQAGGHIVPNWGGRPECTLPCEFVSWSNCNATFRLDDTDRWIEHIIDHLHNKLPRKAICWFCDDHVFDAAECGLDLATNFDNRMRHIQDHIMEESLTYDDIRVDYFMLKHLSRHCLVDKKIAELAWTWTEGPRVEGNYPHDFLPDERRQSSERFDQVPYDLAQERREERRRRKAERQRRR